MTGRRRFRFPPRRALVLFLCLGAMLTFCQAVPTATPVGLAKQITLYNWPDYMPQEVLDAFKQEYGTEVIVQTYDSQEESLRQITSGAVQFDVAVVEYDSLPELIERNLLAEVDLRNIPNFQNIAADFRDLAVDPGNRHNIPYNWGTTGLIVRPDLVDAPVTRWADLWDPRHAGKIGLREQPIEIISIALLSLGYPLNSEDPAQLEAALERLLEIKPSVTFISSDTQEMLTALETGRVAILHGWNGDALIARENFPSIQYVLPSEGTMLWGETFVLSAHSANRYTSEVFIDYILRPQVSARIVEALYYPSANELASQWLPPGILNDPIIYPPHDYLTANRFYTPLSTDGKALYEEIWRRFTTAP